MNITLICENKQLFLWGPKSVCIISSSYKSCYCCWHNIKDECFIDSKIENVYQVLSFSFTHITTVISNIFFNKWNNKWNLQKFKILFGCGTKIELETYLRNISLSLGHFQNWNDFEDDRVFLFLSSTESWTCIWNIPE